MDYMDNLFIDTTEEAYDKETRLSVRAECIPDGRHMMERDLFCRVAPIWLIDRQTRIRMHPETEAGYRGA